MNDKQLQPSFASGEEFGGCRVVQSIGQSEGIEVYLAETLQGRQPVALKILCGDLDGRLNRFLTQVKRWSRFEHPNLVQVRHIGEEKGVHFVVTDYVSGESLDGLVEQRGGPLPWRSAVRMIQLVARGLHFLHEGMIHHDIRPSNIILSSTLEVVLLEFDIAADQRTLPSESPRSAAIKKVAFRSPERCRGESLDRRTDVYGLGATLYYLLGGALPFSGSAAEIRQRIAEGETPPRVDELNSDVPPEVASWVARMMAARRDDRPKSAAVVVRKSRRLLKQFKPPPPPPRRHGGLVAPPLQTLQKRSGELLPLQAPWESLPTKLQVGAIAVLGIMVVALCLILFAS